MCNHSGERHDIIWSPPLMTLTISIVNFKIVWEKHKRKLRRKTKNQNKNQKCHIHVLYSGRSSSFKLFYENRMTVGPQQDLSQSLKWLSHTQRPRALRFSNCKARSSQYEIGNKRTLIKFENSYNSGSWRSWLGPGDWGRGSLIAFIKWVR